MAVKRYFYNSISGLKKINSNIRRSKGVIAFIYNNTRVMYDSNKLVQKDLCGETICSVNCVSFKSKTEITDYIDRVGTSNIIDISKIQNAEIIV